MSIVRAVCGQSEPLAQSKRVGFSYTLPEQPAFINADPHAIRTLFLLLIDNGIKYTPAGGQIQVSFRSVDGQALVEVRDTGIGISKDDFPHIFERFYQADKARSREMGGAGLGLSIARWIADIHRASIHVESTPVAGSLFRISIPLASPERDAAAGKSSG